MTEFAPIVLTTAAELYIMDNPTGVWATLSSDEQAPWITEAQQLLMKQGAFTSANNIAG